MLINLALVHWCVPGASLRAKQHYLATLRSVSAYQLAARSNQSTTRRGDYSFALAPSAIASSLQTWLLATLHYGRSLPFSLTDFGIRVLTSWLHLSITFACEEILRACLGSGGFRSRPLAALIQDVWFILFGWWRIEQRWFLGISRCRWLKAVCLFPFLFK